MLIAAVASGLMLRSYLHEREDRLAREVASMPASPPPPGTPQLPANGGAMITPASTSLPAAKTPSTSELTYRPSMGYRYPYGLMIDITPPWAPGTTMKFAGSVSFAARKVEEAEVTRLLSGVGATRDSAGLTDLRQASVLDVSGTYADDGYLEASKSHRIKATALASASGGLVASADDSALPLMLGNCCALPFDPLPRAGETTWQVQSESPLTMPVQRGRNDLLGMVGLDRNRFQRAGAALGATAIVKERTIYRLGERRDNYQVIHKQQSLEAFQNGAATPILSLVGEGKIDFDVAQGMPAACEMKFTLSGQRGGETLRVPVSVRYSLLKVERKADVESRIDDLIDSRSNTAASQKPPTPEETQIVEEFLQSAKQKNTAGVRLEVFKLSQLRSIAVYQEEVSKALDRFVNDKDLRDEPFVLTALEQWGTALNIPKLLAVIEGSGSTWSQKTGVYQTVGYICSRDAKAAQQALPVLVSRLQIKDEGHSAKQALIRVGPAAEALVLEQLDRSEGQQLDRAVQILGEVGTEKSLPALTKLSQDGQGSSYSNLAISQIKQRIAAKAGS